MRTIKRTALSYPEPETFPRTVTTSASIGDWDEDLLDRIEDELEANSDDGLPTDWFAYAQLFNAVSQPFARIKGRVRYTTSSVNKAPSADLWLEHLSWVTSRNLIAAPSIGPDLIAWRSMDEPAVSYFAKYESLPLTSWAMTTGKSSWQRPEPIADELGVAATPSDQLQAALRDLQFWLGASRRQASDIAGISRGTSYAWRGRDSVPRPNTVRSVLQIHAMVESVVRILGEPMAREWFHSGDPSPMDSLLEARGDSTAIRRLSVRIRRDLIRPPIRQPSRLTALDRVDPDEQ